MWNWPFCLRLNSVLCRFSAIMAPTATHLASILEDWQNRWTLSEHNSRLRKSVVPVIQTLQQRMSKPSSKHALHPDALLSEIKEVIKTLRNSLRYILSSLSGVFFRVCMELILGPRILQARIQKFVISKFILAYFACCQVPQLSRNVNTDILAQHSNFQKFNDGVSATLHEIKNNDLRYVQSWYFWCQFGQQHALRISPRRSIAVWAILITVWPCIMNIYKKSYFTIHFVAVWARQSWVKSPVASSPKILLKSHYQHKPGVMKSQAHLHIWPRISSFIQQQLSQFSHSKQIFRSCTPGRVLKDWASLLQMANHTNTFWRYFLIV